MNKAEFLARLQTALSPLKAQEREDALAYYDEWIEDRMQDRECPEEEAVASLAPPEEIAASILENHSPQQEPREAPEAEGTRVMTADGDQVRRVMIRTKNTTVTIKPSDSLEFTLRYTEDEFHSYDCVLDKGELSLELRPAVRFFDWRIGLIIRPRHTIELSVPRDFAASIDAQTSNASLGMEGIALWGTLRLCTSNDKLQAKNLEAKEIDLQTTNSALTAESLKSGGTIAIKTSNGRVDASELRAGKTLSIQTSNGRVNADKLTGGVSIRLQSSNSPLHVSGLEANNLTLLTSNASISGSVKGSAADYTVHSGTSNAKNSLSEHKHSGEKILDARTSNGSIKLEFEG